MAIGCSGSRAVSGGPGGERRLYGGEGRGCFEEVSAALWKAVLAAAVESRWHWKERMNAEEEGIPI